MCVSRPPPVQRWNFICTAWSVYGFCFYIKLLSWCKFILEYDLSRDTSFFFSWNNHLANIFFIDSSFILSPWFEISSMNIFLRSILQFLKWPVRLLRYYRISSNSLVLKLSHWNCTQCLLVILSLENHRHPLQIFAYRCYFVISQRFVLSASSQPVKDITGQCSTGVKHDSEELRVVAEMGKFTPLALW